MSKRLLVKPEDWVIKDGLLVPKWSVQLAPPKPGLELDRDVITYATFKELYPKDSNTEEDIKQGFGEYWLNDIVQVLAKLNYITFFTQFGKTNKEELALMAPFLSDFALSNFIHHTGLRKLVTRQQLLANLRLAFLYSSENPEKKKAFGNEKDFGQLLYRVTDFLEGYTAYLDNKNPTEEERHKLFMTFARNMFFNEHSTFVLSLTRYWFIFNQIARLKKNRQFKIRTLFSQATGGTDYNYLLALGFAIWGFYSEPNKLQRISQPHEFLFSHSYFRKTSPRTRSKLKKALALLSANYSFYAKEFQSQKNHEGKHFMLNPFWKKPILRNEGNAYFILDLNFLEHRLGEGAFWYIFDSAKDNTERMEAKRKWGYLFESYVNHLVKSTYTSNPKRVFSEIDGEETGGVDLIIYYPDTLILIEVTTKQVRYDHWIESNYKQLEESLHRILIKDTKSRGKAKKLNDVINELKTGKLKLDGVDISQIKNFIPVVLFENSPPMHRGLWHFYQDFMLKNGITDRRFLDDLEFWDIEGLEMILADVLKGRSLPDIIKEKEDAGFYKDSIRNFYIIKRKHFDKHPVLENAFETMTKRFTRILFNRQKITIPTSDGFELEASYGKYPESKKLIIFAHGMTVDRDDEGIFVVADEKLNELGYSTIRFDFRAHGRSKGNSVTDFTISNELLDLDAIFSFAKQEGYEWIGLAGASFGGSISALYAGEHPEIVQRLFLANPVLDYDKCFLHPTTDWGKQYFTNIFERIDRDGFIEIASRKFKVGRKLFEEMSQYNPCDMLRKYPNPLMIVHGDKDTYIPYDHVVECFGSLKNRDKRFEKIEGAEHGFDSDPHETNVGKMIVEFFTNDIQENEKSNKK